MRDSCCDMFRVLGVGTRVKILEILKSKGPLGAKKIAEMVGVTPAAVSQHLKLMRQAGLVNSERHGYFIPYSIDTRGLEKCGRELTAVCTCDCGTRDGAVVRRVDDADVESLERYRKDLEKELAGVKARIRRVRQRQRG
ncbi:MAG: metalloregulator ArsR/SmtB family transcription factor [Candidatus Eisenbacteria bacterium]